MTYVTVTYVTFYPFFVVLRFYVMIMNRVDYHGLHLYLFVSRHIALSLKTAKVVGLIYYNRNITLNYDYDCNRPQPCDNQLSKHLLLELNMFLKHKFSLFFRGVGVRGIQGHGLAMGMWGWYVDGERVP